VNRGCTASSGERQGQDDGGALERAVAAVGKASSKHWGRDDLRREATVLLGAIFLGVNVHVRG
jgi:hypothetical protein